jgi:hypothetical protein
MVGTFIYRWGKKNSDLIRNHNKSRYLGMCFSLQYFSLLILTLYINFELHVFLRLIDKFVVAVVVGGWWWLNVNLMFCFGLNLFIEAYVLNLEQAEQYNCHSQTQLQFGGDHMMGQTTHPPI